jgi:hypothetical protein
MNEEMLPIFVGGINGFYLRPLLQALSEQPYLFDLRKFCSASVEARGPLRTTSRRIGASLELSMREGSLEGLLEPMASPLAASASIPPLMKLCLRPSYSCFSHPFSS